MITNVKMNKKSREILEALLNSEEEIRNGGELSYSRELLFAFLLLSYMRVSEICSLKHSAIDICAGIVQYKADKTGEIIRIYLSDTVRILMQKYCKIHDEQSEYLFPNKELTDPMQVNKAHYLLKKTFGISGYQIRQLAGEFWKERHLRNMRRKEMENYITIRQLDEVSHRETPIYLKSTEDNKGDELILLTNYLRGSEGICSWAIQKLLPAENGKGFIAVIDIPKITLDTLREERQ